MPGNETVRGHLEKRKDWIRRTRDHQEKAADIRKLRRSARERNPDEFQFHMLRSQVGLDGIHRDLETKEEEEQSETQRLLNDVSDIKFVHFKLGMERKKIAKLKETLHLSEETRPKQTQQNKHIIFAEDEEEARNFDPRQYFKTSEHFVARSFNRPVTDEAQKVLSEAEKQKKKEAEKERRRLYAEFCKRMERERELTVVLQKLELKRDLALSRKSELKPKLIKKGDAQRAAIYKWKYERKK